MFAYSTICSLDFILKHGREREKDKERERDIHGFFFWEL